MFERFFNKEKKISWFKVFGSETESNEKVPLNRAVTVLIGKQKIALARTNSGFFAVNDECPHLGASLSKGVCNGMNEIVCPWHSQRFHLKTGHEMSGDGRGTGVETYEVEMREDGLFIGIKS